MGYSLFYTEFPAFDLSIQLENNCIIAVDFLQKAPRLLNEDVGADANLVQEVNFQLDSYLKTPGFKFDLPLQLSGSAFQMSVWRVMQGIKSGSTMSYADVAWVLNSGARAVGRVCGMNKISLLVPCHRIIAKNGQLGGFMQSREDVSNLAIKRWLLEHEKNNNY